MICSVRPCPKAPNWDYWLKTIWIEAHWCLTKSRYVCFWRTDAVQGYVLDGFPRTVEQARALDEALRLRGKGIDRVLLIDVPESDLIDRLGGRWICRTCQTPYHATNNPPKGAGKCDLDGGELYQRDDDKAETVRNRLRVYASQTAPLIDYYQRAGTLSRIDGAQGIDSVREQLLAKVR